MFKLALVYDSGDRYIIPFEIIQTTLNLTEDDVAKIRVAALREVAKG